MLSNFHTHTVFCDGKNTAKETVLQAISEGFDALGFSGHGYTSFDLQYCINDMGSYISEINRLKEKYKNKIQIYLGIEEDSACLVNRADFDYLIGSSHYFLVNDKYYPVDLSYEELNKCISLSGGPIKFAEYYYKSFCDYIEKRHPDIIGHFDLITKFDEKNAPLFLENEEYNQIAEKYLMRAIKSSCIFEVNTGAISRGYRTTPYPSTNLLHLLKKEDVPIILSSDSHSKDTLNYGFYEAKKLLKDVGFQYIYTLFNNEFIKYYI